MFFALLFLVLTVLGAQFLPDWSWPMLLGSAFAIVVVLRLALALRGRRDKSADPA